MNSSRLAQLSPSQEWAYQRIVDLIANKDSLIAVRTRNGNGRTTILRKLAAHLGAHMVTLGDVFQKTGGFHPLQVEEGIAETLFEPLGNHQLVLMDDLHVITDIFNNCHVCARPRILQIALEAVLACLSATDKQLVVGLRDWAPAPLHQRSLYVKIPALTPGDFRYFFRTMLAGRADNLDFERIHRFAPRLDLHQMKYVSRILPADKIFNTDDFLNFLEEHALVSNVDTGNVEVTSLDSLYGVDDVIRSLEVDVVVPMERPDLADQIGLKPKRGVLLYGPPGTGKTTVGRALAHRLRSKFFLIDGTVISGTPDFFQKVHHIFESARENAPSVLFIDDSDLLFEDGMMTGLYRYLLTKLDGLESIENSQITVILTAMNIGSLPPALIRSGRIELWLMMQLPDAAARAAIFQDHLMRTTPYLQKVDLTPIVAKTEGFTGADVKRVVADAINLYGYEIAREQEPDEPLAYFEQAIERLAKHRARLEAAPPITSAHHGAASRHQQGFAVAMAALQQQQLRMDSD